MKRLNRNVILAFCAGMLVFAAGSFVLSTFIFPQRPSAGGIVEDWGRICIWPDVSGIYAAVSPQGCYSSTCTAPKLQTGVAIVDSQAHRIRFETRFVLSEASQLPLPCSEDCAGGGSVDFNLGELLPNDYEVWFRAEYVGQLLIFSGRPTPRQCFENSRE